MSTYARFIVHHSYLVLLIVTVVSTVLTIIPLVCHDLPSFTDPLVGFETRGTTLAHRFIAWANLIDETRPSRRLAVNPKEIEDQIRMNNTYNKSRPDKTRSGYGRKNQGKNNKKNTNHNNTRSDKPLYPEAVNNNVSNVHVHWGYGKNVSYEDEDMSFIKEHTRKQWLSLKNMQGKYESTFFHNYAYGKCGSPLSNYAHLVIATSDNTSLLTFENVQKVCQFQSHLVQMGGIEYHELCQRLTHSEEVCCPVWSVPNYIALMSSKESCENLTREDVNKAITVLSKCSGYFHNFTLMASCDLDRCKVPKYCAQYDAVYNLLFYIIDSDAFSPSDLTQNHVQNSMLFFPLPRSSTVLPYYIKLQSSNMIYDNLIIAGIDFGLKNTLFDLWLIQDTWLVGLGGLFVFLFVWIYTRSLILTILLFTAILYSIGVAYFLYVYVFNLQFFPFMNLLVVVVVIGIGADDAFLYVKVWKMVGKQLLRDNVDAQGNGLGEIKNVSSAGETILIQVLEETLKHSVVAIFVTALTTSVAFFASYVSYIPAINCFSVFAGTAVLVNFILMVSWLPVSVFLVDVKLTVCNRKVFNLIYKIVNEISEDIRVIFDRFIIVCVAKCHIVFVIVLGAIGILSIIVVFYTPGLKLPDSRQFQLFQTEHPFEQYEINYKDKFLFERFGTDIGVGYKMPLRWIWGVEAIDNGNHMNPYSKGKLVFDENFSMSDPRAQAWLLRFCARIKAQPFYQQTLGPLLPNCFIESFNMYMERRCIDKIDKLNRTPCCESSPFPYEKEVFNFCILKAIESLYQTPRELFMPGVAGPKFLRTSTPPSIAAIVIEFESVVPYSMSYTAMNAFFNHVENWTQEELKSAPPSMKYGWFISDFQFYDLQKTLASGTITALMLSAGLGLLVLLPATFNFIVSICALTAMIFSATVTISILVLFDWKLNVLESIAISTSAGLAVDFSLHYALSYTNSTGPKVARVKYALSASAGPTGAAALTSGFAGIFLLRSNLLPYSQIGTFLALIMSVSWTYATFFLCSLLYVFGANSPKDLRTGTDEEHKSVPHVSSICSGIPNLESHELEHLADSNHTNLTHSHSPSNTSSTTRILNHENDNEQSKTDKSQVSITNITMTELNRSE